MNSQKSVTANFALSAATTNSFFVRQQYVDFLDREPDAGGFSGWVDALNGGLTRANLIETFMDSEEFYFQGKFIARAYLGILTRDADYAGFRAWLEVLLDGMSREQIVQFFLESGEFQAKFGSNLTNSQFVDRMYANVLLRSADVGGFNAWVGGLNSGQITRAQVALSLSGLAGVSEPKCEPEPTGCVPIVLRSAATRPRPWRVFRLGRSSQLRPAIHNGN